LSITFAIGQELDSISMTFENGLVVVKYDFLNGEKDEDYELYLYGSHDNFAEPLQYTSGDVGKKIRIGTGKVIYWDAKKELGNFKGDFSLKIRGTKYIPFVTFKNINKDLKIKRGDVFEIKYTPSIKAEQVIMKIQRYGVPVDEPFPIDNTGVYAWDVPRKLKAGKGYTIQILDTKNMIKEETSEPFVIRRRVATVYKVIPAVAIVGGVVFYLTQNKDKGIPGPPALPER
jgi:hypothetical protein